MISIFIDSIKTTHTLYHYLQSRCSNKFCFGDSDSDLIIVSLEDVTSQSRINNVLSRGKKLLVYFEHIGSLVVDVDHEFITNLLSNPLFCGFVSHSADTCKLLKERFPNAKIFNVPVGVYNQDENKIEKRLESHNGTLNFVFWSSWNDVNNNNFYGRGGFYADEIFLRVRRQRNCTLTIRSHVALNSSREFPDSVRVIPQYLPQEELFNIYMASDLLFLTSAQAHFITIPEAMSFGLPIIGTTTWGFSENVEDKITGIIEPCNQKWELCRDRGSLDCEYVDKVVDRLASLGKEDLKSMSLNALKYQRNCHNVDNYPNYFENILETLNDRWLF